MSARIEQSFLEHGRAGSSQCIIGSCMVTSEPLARPVRVGWVRGRTEVRTCAQPSRSLPLVDDPCSRHSCATAQPPSCDGLLPAHGGRGFAAAAVLVLSARTSRRAPQAGVEVQMSCLGVAEVAMSSAPSAASAGRHARARSAGMRPRIDRSPPGYFEAHGRESV
jgi:hypothetical protein